MRTSTFDLGKYGYMDIYQHDYIIHNQVRKTQELWCKDLFEYVVGLVKKDKPVLVDCGAHCGLFSIPFCVSTGGRAVAFEPQENLFELLNKNFAQNNLTDYESYHAAVGSKCLTNLTLNKGDEGYAAANKDGLPSNLGGVSVGQGGEGGIEMVSLDSLGLEACDLLKIDVEGAEPYVIEGAKDTIEKFKPVILYENNWKKPNDYMIEKMGEPMDIKEFLRPLGYTFEDRDADVVAYIKE